MGTFHRIGVHFGRWLTTNSCRFQVSVAPVGLSPLLWSGNYLPALSVGATRNYAARKGTRERRDKIVAANKAKNKAKEARRKAQGISSFPKHIQKAMMKKMAAGRIDSRLPDDSEKPSPEDNVWVIDEHRRPKLTVEQAVISFKESHHPTILNLPKAYISAWIEMDLSTKKKSIFVNPQGVVLFPHMFPRGPTYRLCVFCKTKEQISEALALGAHTAVGLEGVKMFREGQLDDEDFDYVLAHMDIITELSPIRGILELKFPNAKRGTVINDLKSVIPKFLHGLQYTTKQDVNNKAFGIVDLNIGQVEMDPLHVEENFRELVADILKQKVKNAPSSLVEKALIKCENTSETFEINMEPYLKTPIASAVTEEDAKGTEDSKQERAAATG